MKKNLENLVSKLSPDNTGNLSGGFASIRGGMSAFYLATNTSDCTNSGTCNGTNQTTCTNSGTCTKATNSIPSSCSNTGTCAA